MLDVNILNTRVRLLVQDRSFYLYLKSVLEDYLSNNKDVDIVSRFEWQSQLFRKNPLRIEKEKGQENIGPNILLSKEGDDLQFLKKIHGRRFKIKLKMAEGKIQQGLFCHKKILKDLMGKKSQVLDFFEISYFLFYYPLFWFLENFSRIYPMHASCVDTPKGGIIIAGLPGSGKSVTSIALWNKDSKNRFVSDNIILYDRENVYACPEPIRLHDEGKRLVEGDRLVCIDIASKKSNKGFYKIQKNRTEISKPVIFLMVKLSARYSLKEIDVGSAATLVFNQNLQGAELLNYFEYASLLGFLTPQKNLFKERLETLDCIFKGLRCFLLSIPRDKSVDSVANTILDLL